MEMPANVYATLAAMVDKFPHTGSDDERRAAMEKAVATIRQRHGPQWVWKTEHQSLIAPSKDGIGYVTEEVIVHGRYTQMFLWDTISGSTRKLNAAPLVSLPDSPRGAFLLAVPPKDWLGETVPVEPSPPTNTSDLLKRIGDAEAQLKALQEQVSAAELDARHAWEMALKLNLGLATGLKAAIDLPIVINASTGYRPRARGDVTITVPE